MKFIKTISTKIEIEITEADIDRIVEKYNLLEEWDMTDKYEAIKYFLGEELQDWTELYDEGLDAKVSGEKKYELTEIGA